MESLRAGGQCDSWYDRWRVWNRAAPERRIWRVAYVRSERPGPPSAVREDLAAVRRELETALAEIHDFACRHECGGFIESFAVGLGALRGASGAKRGYHMDLAPPGILSADALAILDASQHASVFGGMGSWNDMSFDGAEGEAYDRVSERLFRAVNRAIAAAANESFRRN